MTYDPGTSCRGNVECCLLCGLKLLIWICKGSKLAAPKDKACLASRRHHLCLATILQGTLGSWSRNERIAQNTHIQR
jgi:hypothetical protein